MIFLGKGHKIIKKILYDVYTPEVWKGGYIQHVTSNSPTPKQVFLATAWAQGAHSPAGLQGVNTTLWCPFKTTELSQYCVGISCLKLLTPGQGTEV